MSQPIAQLLTLQIKVAVRDLVFGCFQESALSGSIPIIVGTIPLIESESEGSSSTVVLSTSNTDANLDEISEVYMPTSASRSTSIELPNYVDSQRRYNSSTRYKDSRKRHKLKYIDQCLIKSGRMNYFYDNIP